jgi:hypothetical protein
VGRSFNPSLLMLSNCHINVEICLSIKMMKYLYKYIYKGDKVVIDEIKQFRDARCVTPPKAVY